MVYNGEGRGNDVKQKVGLAYGSQLKHRCLHEHTVDPH